jgi:hypothetical protein
MKKIGEYTVRGDTPDNGVKRITLFDGRFDTGYVVTSFHIFPRDPTSGSSDSYGCLATEEEAATSDWVAADNRQIGWATSNMHGYGADQPSTLLDPDNLIVEDLYVYGNDAAGNPVNYIITMEKYEFTDWRGALAMVRNSAQNV